MKTIEYTVDCCYVFNSFVSCSNLCSHSGTFLVCVYILKSKFCALFCVIGGFLNVPLSISVLRSYKVSTSYGPSLKSPVVDSI